MKNKIKNFLLKKRIKIMKNKKGFSLVELLVTVGIMGTLIGVGIPAYNSYQSNSSEQAVKTETTNLLKAFQTCMVSSSANDCATPDINGTISVECDPATASAPVAGTNKCFYDRQSTGTAPNFTADVICWSSHKSAGGDKKACVQYNILTNKVSVKLDTTKFCKNDGTCS